MVGTVYHSPDFSSVHIGHWHPQQNTVHSFARLCRDETLVRVGPSSGRHCSLSISTDNCCSFNTANEDNQHLDDHKSIRVSKSLDFAQNMELLAALHSMDIPSIATLLQKNSYISTCIMAHEHVIGQGLDQDVIFCSLLVASYSKCRYIHLARAVFDRLHLRNVITWTTMIASYVDHGLADEALSMFNCMFVEGIQPNAITFLAAMGACAKADYLEEGIRLHIIISSLGLDSDIAVNTGLIKMYGQCGDVEKAVSVFRRMNTQDVISWTAVITVHAQLGLSKEVLEFFHEMERAVEPNVFTLVGVIGACGNLKDLTQGRAIHARLKKRNLHSDSVVGTALVHMYAKCGMLKEAFHAFNEIGEPDAVSFTAMISAYTQNGQAQAALEMYQGMPAQQFKPSAVTFSMLLCIYAELNMLSEGQEIHFQIIKHGFTSDLPLMNALLYMYGKCGCLLKANILFKQMQQRDVVSCTTMMAAFLEKGQGVQVFVLLDQMEQEGLNPDDATYSMVFKSCSVLCMPGQGRSYHASIVGKGFSMNGALGTALLEMYCKCGALKDAKQVFNSMKHHDQTAWNSIIMAHSQEGDGKKAIQLFEQMTQEKIAPDEKTFVGLLSGCSHAGLVKEGCSYFESMRHNYGIPTSVEHNGCMVDLLGRGAYLDAAEDFIEKSPLRPNGCMWSALLGACIKHGDVARGKRAAKFITICEPENAAPYVLLSRMYATEGKAKDAHAILQTLAKLGLKKKPGCTHIEVNNNSHKFLANEGLHKDKDSILDLLENLKLQAREMGYIPDTKLVLHNVSEKVKVHLLGHHSERMALAFGLLNTPSKTPLHLAKNLRTCPDCHSFMKAVSKIVNREIVLKDINRIHRFKDGVCSCDDYW
ncbi:hypothetical protein L7F22_025778 [Adiantum nelumboides]|nr:hypothetical protein [Adiantum nelumboides]